MSARRLFDTLNLILCFCPHTKEMSGEPELLDKPLECRPTLSVVALNVTESIVLEISGILPNTQHLDYEIYEEENSFSEVFIMLDYYFFDG